MLNKLNLVFQDNSFETVATVSNNHNLKLLKRDNNERFEYYVIVEVNSLDNLLKEQQLNYLKILKKHISDKEVDKNSTLLICLKSESLPISQSIYKQILEIEEDPYYFRKLVLTYTQSQLEEIREISNFEDIIKNPNLFDEFRENCKSKNLSESKYEIISQLYIKLPFFKLPVVPQSKNLVIDEYKESLNEEQIKVFNFLENTNIAELIENEDFYKKLKDL